MNENQKIQLFMSKLELKPKVINNNNNNNESNHLFKKEQIKLLIKEVLYNSLAQAIIKIFQTPHITLKLFLATFVLVSTGLASFLVIQSFLEYFSFGVSTMSRTINENPTLFPKVTICNFNPFTTEYAFNMIQLNVTSGNNLSDEEKKRLGHDLNDILLECSFNMKPCDLADFVWSFDQTYGNCYTFNSVNENRTLKQSTVSDIYFGLDLTLYINIYEKILKFRKLTTGMGAIIRIGNSSYMTYYSNGGTFITPGHQTYLSVEREFKSILPKPYSDCEIDSNSAVSRKDSGLYNLIGPTEYAYTQQLCFTQCFQEFVKRNYNCTMPYVVSFFNVSTCNWDYSYLVEILNDFERKNFLSEVCLPSCPLECNKTLYKVYTSSVHLVGEQFISAIQRNPKLTSDFINRSIDSMTARESFVKVHINYETLSYTITSESPQMTVVSLLASIGGHLGLFLGVNFFSIWEIIEVIMEIMFILRERKR